MLLVQSACARFSSILRRFVAPSVLKPYDVHEDAGRQEKHETRGDARVATAGGKDAQTDRSAIATSAPRVCHLPTYPAVSTPQPTPWMSPPASFEPPPRFAPPLWKTFLDHSGLSRQVAPRIVRTTTQNKQLWRVCMFDTCTASFLGRSTTPSCSTAHLSSKDSVRSQFAELRTACHGMTGLDTAVVQCLGRTHSQLRSPWSNGGSGTINLPELLVFLIPKATDTRKHENFPITNYDYSPSWTLIHQPRSREHILVGN